MVFNKDLNELVIELKESYRKAEPFPHVVINDLFKDSALDACLNEIPDSEKDLNLNWNTFADPTLQVKKSLDGRTQDLSRFPNTFKILQSLNSYEFVKFLRDLLDIPDLMSDSTYRGAGIHEISRGGKLGVHVDFSKYMNFWRRANCLLYLNKDWKDEYEGHLQLFDKSVRDGGKCIKKVAPSYNSLIIFGTSKNSWHGHPTPLNTPPGVKRRSLATYYYAPTPGEDTVEHGTIFK